MGQGRVRRWLGEDHVRVKSQKYSELDIIGGNETCSISRSSILVTTYTRDTTPGHIYHD